MKPSCSFLLRAVVLAVRQQGAAAAHSEQLSGTGTFISASCFLRRILKLVQQSQDGGCAVRVVLFITFILIGRVGDNRVDRDAVRLASVRSAAVDPLRQQTGEGEGGKR